MSRCNRHNSRNDTGSASPHLQRGFVEAAMRKPLVLCVALFALVKLFLAKSRRLSNARGQPLSHRLQIFRVKAAISVARHQIHAVVSMMKHVNREISIAALRQGLSDNDNTLLHGH